MHKRAVKVKLNNLEAIAFKVIGIDEVDYVYLNINDNFMLVKKSLLQIKDEDFNGLEHKVW